MGTSENYCDFLLVQLTSDLWPCIPGLLTVCVKQRSCGWPRCISHRKLCFTTNFFTSCGWDALGGCSTLHPPYARRAFAPGSKTAAAWPLLFSGICVAVLTKKVTMMTTSALCRAYLQRAFLSDPNHSGISGTGAPLLILRTNPLCVLLWSIPR